MIRPAIIASLMPDGSRRLCGTRTEGGGRDLQGACLSDRAATCPRAANQGPAQELTAAERKSIEQMQNRPRQPIGVTNERRQPYSPRAMTA